MNEEKRGKKSIFRKILIIVISVFIIESVLFALSFALASDRLVGDVTNIRLEDYLKTAQLLDDPFEVVETPGEGIERVVIKLYDGTTDISEGVLNLLSTDELEHIINEAKLVSFNEYNHGSLKRGSQDVYYAYTATKLDTIIIAICSDSYLNSSIMDLIILVSVLYVSIFLIAIVVIMLWIHHLVRRLNRLCTFVTEMKDEEYKKSYIDDGDDELYTLSAEVERMRQTIESDEAKKQAMLQNVSHDLKTPIAVIKSYVEAIEDGVEDINATEIIIEQCNKLERKVKSFIEFNRLEYLSEEVKNPVVIKDIIENIVLNLKHLVDVEIRCELDDSIFYGRYENYFTVCENIIENAVRYAVKLIDIKLKDNVLTIYNDGKHIDEKFITEGFKPYEKGSEGKFGLGMSIVSRTLEIFNMKLEVCNLEVGVKFTIKNK